jgi:nicotinamide riboside transporter PnuC
MKEHGACVMLYLILVDLVESMCWYEWRGEERHQQPDEEGFYHIYEGAPRMRTAVHGPCWSGRVHVLVRVERRGASPVTRRAGLYHIYEGIPRMRAAVPNPCWSGRVHVLVRVQEYRACVMLYLILVDLVESMRWYKWGGEERHQQPDEEDGLHGSLLRPST